MKKILIVDDEAGICSTLRMTLEHAQYQVWTAENGLQGLQAARSVQPDLIIADVLMPVMDGYHFFKHLKNDPATKQIPIIILTARGQMEETFKIFDVDAFLEKPSGMQLLLQTVEKILSRPRLAVQHKRILIAGLNRKIVDEIQQRLNALEQRVAAVYSGAEILVQGVVLKPDIIIMDIQMEHDRSSAQIIKALRLVPHLQNIPILTYSYVDATQCGLYEVRWRADKIQVHQRRCQKAGSTIYLGPYNPDQVLEKIRPFLEIE